MYNYTFTKSYCPSGDGYVTTDKQDKCPVCGGWLTLSYEPKEK